MLTRIPCHGNKNIKLAGQALNARLLDAIISNTVSYQDEAPAVNLDHVLSLYRNGLNFIHASHTGMISSLSGFILVLRLGTALSVHKELHDDFLIYLQILISSLIEEYSIYQLKASEGT